MEQLFGRIKTQDEESFKPQPFINKPVMVTTEFNILKIFMHKIEWKQINSERSQKQSFYYAKLKFIWKQNQLYMSTIHLGLDIKC